MARIILARGCRGGIARKLQIALASGGYYTGGIDGAYGGGTERAVAALQKAKRLVVTGAVDEATWKAATAAPLPSVAERCLQLTAAFEGHGFSIVQGNFDGAWLTWGIIGFTLKFGSIQKIVLQAWQLDPSTVRAAFGERTNELIGLMTRNKAAELQRWANAISVTPSMAPVIEPWRSSFMRLGESPLVQQIQIQRAMQAYFDPCLQTAAKYNLTTELGVALAFDIHVQNGSVKPEAHAQIVRRIGADFTKQREAERREVIANAVADHASRPYREDVRSRKLTLANGSGTVHGEFFKVANWGLGEYAALGRAATATEAGRRAAPASSRAAHKPKRTPAKATPHKRKRAT
jgi:hypothetical protein